MADIQKENELLKRQLYQLKKQEQQRLLQEQNKALQAEIDKLKKASTRQCKLFSQAITVSC